MFRHARRIALRLVTALSVAALASGVLAAPAAAAVLDTDYIGGVPVGPTTERRATAPDLYIPAGMLSAMDGRELWARDPESRRAMASTTKIMTAVVALESGRLDEDVTVDRVASTVGESGMLIRPGEVLTVRQLLEGVLIQSGNDAATMLARHLAGSVPSFVKRMNDKAVALDMPNTRYRNPHGLDVPGHYTSAEDLTHLARYAMRNPEFRAIVARRTGIVRSDRYTHRLKSHNTMLKTYPGATGIKTGWTDEAGYCIVVSAKRGDIELVATVLGAASEGGRVVQARKLLDWGFAHYRPTTLVTAGEPAGRVPISDYLERTVGARAAETTALPVFDLSGPLRRRIELDPAVDAPVRAGQRIGTMTIYQEDRLLAQVPVVADADVPEPEWWQRVLFFFARLTR